MNLLKLKQEFKRGDFIKCKKDIYKNDIRDKEQYINFIDNKSIIFKKNKTYVLSGIYININKVHFFNTSHDITISSFLKNFYIGRNLLIEKNGY